MFAKNTFVTNLITYIGQYTFNAHFIHTQGSVFFKTFIQKRVKTITGIDFLNSLCVIIVLAVI